MIRCEQCGALRNEAVIATGTVHVCGPTYEELLGIVDSRTRVANELQRSLERSHSEVQHLQVAMAAINVPETRDFAKAVELEAAHQRLRWGSEHDAGKSDADWFWLIGYLGGKALHNPGGDPEKQLHRIITVAAAAANWHAHKLGLTNMRPGIEDPK